MVGLRRVGTIREERFEVGCIVRFFSGEVASFLWRL